MAGRWLLGRTLAGASLVCVLGLPQGSFGQEGEPERERAAPRSPWVEMRDLIVTASKRAETVQTAPLSLRAFSPSELEARKLEKLSDLGRATPNLLTDPTSNDNHLRLYIRGVGIDDRIATVDPGVGVYIDGVYQARTYALDRDLLDIERVEVLRGPQGTLYGRNTIGGAINIVTKKPTGRWDTEFKLEAGNFDRLNTSMAMGFPIIDDSLSGRIALRTSYDGGYFENEFMGSDSGYNNNRGLHGRGQLNWVVNENLETTLSVERISKRGNPSGANPNSTCETQDSVFCAAGITQVALAPLADDDAFEGALNGGAMSTFDNNRAGRSDNNIDRTSATLSTMYDLGRSQLKWIASAQVLELRESLDIDGTSLSFLELIDHDQNFQWSQELQLNSSLIDGRLQVVSGLYYFQEDNKNEQTTLVAADRSLAGNPFVAVLSPSLSVDSRTDQKVNSYGGYLSMTYELIPRVSVNAGIRYSYDDKVLKRTEVRREGTVRTDIRGSESFDDLSPTFGIQWQATSDLLVYGKWSRGFRGGGFNGRANASNPLTLLPFDPETIKVVEVGIKSSFWDDRVVFNLAAFRSIFDDVQITTFTFDGLQFINLVNNAGKARLFGLEAELFARPTEGLLVSLGLGTIDAKYLTYREPQPGGPVPVIDASDRDFKNTPELSGNASVAYTFGSLFDGSTTLRADYSYRSQVFYNTANTDSIRQDPVGLLNLRLAWRNAADSLELGVWARNVTNREYDIFGFDFNQSQGFTTTYPAPPREVGVDLTLRY